MFPHSLYNQRRRTSLSFKVTAGQLTVHTQPSCSFVARHQTSIIAPNLWLPSIPDFSTQITESQQCYRSGSIKILCEMLMSWGDMWMTVCQA